MTNNSEKLKNFITSQNIRYVNYSEFTEVKNFEKGGFGVIKKAKWNGGGVVVALKHIKRELYSDETVIRNFVRELKNLYAIGYHPNINQLYGVTQDPDNFIELILQYAEGGNLRDYLRENFTILNWIDKLRIAKEIAQGIGYIHMNKIIHRDLHSKNVLVRRGEMIIADFGISTQLSEDIRSITEYSNVHGMPAYIDPKCFSDPKYIRTEKSDIYSFGVILWEISSGKPPFDELKFRDAIVYRISQGQRETPVKDTSPQYIELYTSCWSEEPEDRPEFKKVFDTLDQFMQTEVSPDTPSPLSSGGASINEQSSGESIVILNESPETDIQPSNGIEIVNNENTIDSVLMKLEHAAYISSWIDNPHRGVFSKIVRKIYKTDNIPYEFKLLIRGSRDGFTPKEFHKKCDNKGPTITVLRVQGTNEILGGYNPFSWIGSTESKYFYTTQSFIFKLDDKKPANSILSRARQHESIKSGISIGPYFRSDLWLEENFKENCRCLCYPCYYEKPIRASKEFFSIDEYEVFQLIKKNL